MLIPGARAVTPFGVRGAFANQRRHASIKEIGLRIKSVGNIQKITAANKMVASAKQKHDMRRMTHGLPFAEPVSKFMERITIPEEIERGPALLVGISGDKGMCGGVNSAIGKALRNSVIKTEAAGVELQIGLLGAKGGTLVKRIFGDRFLFSFEQFAKVGLNFSQVAAAAAAVMKVNPASFRVYYNKFLTMASYETCEVPCVTPTDMANMDKYVLSGAIDAYNFEPPLTEMGDDFHSFYYACTLFGGCLHGAAAEQSARVQAMENASSNAGDMLERLGLQYNKARQAKITTELCEIVSGAAAVSG